MIGDVADRACEPKGEHGLVETDEEDDEELLFEWRGCVFDLGQSWVLAPFRVDSFAVECMSES